MNGGSSGPILLVGCGKMGGALVSGWRARGVAAERIVIVEPVEAARAAAAKLGVMVLAAAPKADPNYPYGAVVLAVKPQMMGAVAPLYASLMSPTTVALSIAAGTTTTTLRNHLGANAAVVRAMPNTPASVGRGMTVLFAAAGVTPHQAALCAELMEAVGEVRWVKDETLIDAVTAVSGSGPAYVFYLIETMTAAGVAAGLDAALAADLARATVIGSGELARQSADSAATLRTNVTSPGGTTEAALKVLMTDPGGLKDLMMRAVDAAAKRSRELSKS
jgi:pyrroline-5-carboxylate reductase